MTWMLVLVAVSLLPQTACCPDCSQREYRQTIDLPTAVDASDCALTIEGPSGGVVTSDVPSPGSTVYYTSCAATGGSYAVSCTRSPSSSGSPQELLIDVTDADVPAFEQAVGGTSFTVSLSCGGVSVLDHAAQSVERLCAD